MEAGRPYQEAIEVPQGIDAGSWSHSGSGGSDWITWWISFEGSHNE